MGSEMYSVVDRLQSLQLKYYPADLGAVGHVVTDAYTDQFNERPAKEERPTRAGMMRVNVYPLSFVPTMDEVITKYLKSKERRWVLNGPLRKERNRLKNQREQEKGQKRRTEKEAKEKAIAEAKAAKAEAKAQKAANVNQTLTQSVVVPVPVSTPNLLPIPAASNEPEPKKRKRQRIKVSPKPVITVK
jgi:hypothetical protein